ncbi:MAG TPA: Rieske 2Fe-2S domain-containing protein [Candidatus Acidoferrales bacterium]|nr:Rieske 2Fe-2S domain-containing protein [Candidatus Acidoferrales bacterium]
MADTSRLICPSDAIEEGGLGVRFEVEYFGEPAQAFVVRAGGQAVGYLNRCAHVATELDWLPGRFFDDAGRDLICSTHGAVYAATSGRCLGGPCGGTPLVRLRIEERDGGIFFSGVDDD